MDIKNIFTSVISLIAFFLSLTSFFYVKKKNKRDEGLRVLTEYRKNVRLYFSAARELILNGKGVDITNVEANFRNSNIYIKNLINVSVFNKIVKRAVGKDKKLKLIVCNIERILEDMPKKLNNGQSLPLNSQPVSYSSNAYSPSSFSSIISSSSSVTLQRTLTSLSASLGSIAQSGNVNQNMNMLTVFTDLDKKLDDQIENLEKFILNDYLGVNQIRVVFYWHGLLEFWKPQFIYWRRKKE